MRSTGCDDVKTVAEFIFSYLADKGVKHVFLVVGGGAMFLNEALRKEERITPICNHHEQASAIAAEGYSKVSGELSVVSVTSGPGGTNTITGVLGQWTDSVPVLYVSGQVKRETTTGNTCLRQLGDQEINIIDIIKSITKYSVMITNPNDIKYELQKAIHIATSGRPGPVWLDVPLDIQNSIINESNLHGYVADDEEYIVDNLEEVLSLIRKSSRPLIVAGHGVRIARAFAEFGKFISSTSIPVVTTFNGFDLLPNNSKSFFGRVGTLGSRAGNFILQSSDLLICLGTRNNIRQIGYNKNEFGKNAKKIIVDIDKNELNKPTIVADVSVSCSVSVFLGLLNKNLSYSCDRGWIKWCEDRKDKYSLVIDEHTKDASNINPYVFIEKLTSRLADDSIIVAGNGTACVSLFQSGVVKSNSRVLWNSGAASMGYALPASIGAAFFSGKPVVCITGDGSLQMNIQELATIRHYRLPIKLFVLNNGGYHSIYQTQTNNFGAGLIGCDASWLSFPDLIDVAYTYSLPYCKIGDYNDLEKLLDPLMRHSSFLCEVILGRDYMFMPKSATYRDTNGKLISSSLENLYPFLGSEEVVENMLTQ